MDQAAPDRVAALDLIRGVAVLGILAINIAGFAGPAITALSPGAILPATPADEAAFAFAFLFFEGKMRALFSLLFGASMMLFIESAEAQGRDGDILQFRRLCWLMVFGQLHYLLFWWGDILFSYAACGIVALLLRRMAVGGMITLALAIFTGTHMWAAFTGWPAVVAEEAVRLGAASAGQARAHADMLAPAFRFANTELARYGADFGTIALAKLRERPFWLFEMTAQNLGETLPLMLIGMALYRTGFFAGRWPAHAIRAAAIGAGTLGLGATLAVLAWMWPRHFPIIAMGQAMLSFLAFPHLLMAFAYAALLVIAAPRLCASPPGRWLAAAGAMALSNYIAASAVMTAIFYGWGLGLFGTVGAAGQWAFVLAGWALMLTASAAWLARYRYGPLEWLWRSLTMGHILSNRR
ncbi:DUF418 domain-containing protein [Novosphingobium album (ex Liu et al. 2023)]|uniref:DUF418 domain-containing protein n=1 Tax=Novosphingobium album (ex Liu et al. 2023) TaxID=3031130 RepID=A0ABT5WSE9_9SPHN|nr:DUF418 domain-containing protein [Novosphingobium album (ex Liu et al. 2023)]MDE8652676.1 DUF418 domain-containing protein [Novosphingobium album (ex Liu et al. 2023)]